MKIGNEYYFYHNDHLDTPQKMTDSSGAIVWSEMSEAFGKTIVTVAAIENNLRFPGQYYDAETGLHYNWTRCYDPRTARYLTADPIGLRGGINLFAYVGANPVNKRDPNGLFLRQYKDTILYGGVEGNFVVGTGLEAFTCCEGNERMLSLFWKICLGGGFNVGFALGQVLNAPEGDVDCSKLFKGISIEFGVGPAELTITPTKDKGFWALGFGGGGGGKATVCYYIFLTKFRIGCCYDRPGD